MDIHAGGKYPSNSLSNFHPHPFVIDGVLCSSMEGFLQSLKTKSPEMQKEVCTYIGMKAKMWGVKKNWQQTQILYWQGVAIPRGSKEYQDLLDRAYDALALNTSFQKALLATNNAALTHSIGKKRQKDTVLTQSEFTSRLTAIRTRLQKEKRTQS